MQADHVLRALREGGDAVDVQVRGVRRQDGARLGHGVELAEHGLLHAHFLEHGLNDEVRVLQRGVLQRGSDQAHALLHLLGLELALLHGVLVVLADRGQAPVQRLLLHLQQHHGDAGVEEVHGDAAAHGAGANHAHAGDGAEYRALGQARHLGGRALGLEYMAQRARLGRLHQRLEQRALGLQTLVERLERGRHGLHALQRRREGLAGSGHGVARELQEGVGVGLLDLQVAGARQRFAPRRHLGGEGHGAFDQIALDQRVHQRRAREGIGGHGLARDDHVQRRLQADQPRQALRAARAGQQAQLHLGQAERGVGQGHAVVAAQGQFQPAAQAHAGDGGHHGLGGAVERADHAG